MKVLCSKRGPFITSGKLAVNKNVVTLCCAEKPVQPTKVVSLSFCLVLVVVHGADTAQSA